MVSVADGDALGAGVTAGAAVVAGGDVVVAGGGAGVAAGAGAGGGAGVAAGGDAGALGTGSMLPGAAVAAIAECAKPQSAITTAPANSLDILRSLMRMPLYPRTHQQRCTGTITLPLGRHW